MQHTKGAFRLPTRHRGRGHRSRHITQICHATEEAISHTQGVIQAMAVETRELRLYESATTCYDSSTVPAPDGLVFNKSFPFLFRL